VYVRIKSTWTGQVPLVQSGMPTWATEDQRADHPLSSKCMSVHGWLLPDGASRTAKCTQVLVGCTGRPAGVSSKETSVRI
jgi:hypothetical protein